MNNQKLLDLDDIITELVIIPAKAKYLLKPDGTYSAVYNNVWVNKLTTNDISFLKKNKNKSFKIETVYPDNGGKPYNVIPALPKEEEA